mmetsp:Transcript_265/g.891  ORF Transcript_265/g.891 Transcript_265/m.891 type:complete len:2687 (-) Transcript_265:1185-9245(-)|eukprot:CAMPEP_0117438804 /NCGR_PEP_ID=MMETSP0759-20121206/2243_1 /TAXON_ID=63605 /ORGANISM="Percolomonas cosmopolitus, Strain WS" /LENGTH=2686 /DNA_ID=CAMNT_0005230509 /DNA_START=88 /DNA_END=8148 /DNA_ORIENTATION=-
MTYSLRNSCSNRQPKRHLKCVKGWSIREAGLSLYEITISEWVTPKTIFENLPEEISGSENSELPDGSTLYFFYELLPGDAPPDFDENGNEMWQPKQIYLLNQTCQALGCANPLKNENHADVYVFRLRHSIHPDSLPSLRFSLMPLWVPFSVSYLTITDPSFSQTSYSLFRGMKGTDIHMLEQVNEDTIKNALIRVGRVDANHVKTQKLNDPRDSGISYLFLWEEFPSSQATIPPPPTFQMRALALWWKWQCYPQHNISQPIISSPHKNILVFRLLECKRDVDVHIRSSLQRPYFTPYLIFSDTGIQSTTIHMSKECKVSTLYAAVRRETGLDVSQLARKIVYDEDFKPKQRFLGDRKTKRFLLILYEKDPTPTTATAEEEHVSDDDLHSSSLTDSVSTTSHSSSCSTTPQMRRFSHWWELNNRREASSSPLSGISHGNVFAFLLTEAEDSPFTNLDGQILTPPFCALKVSSGYCNISQYEMSVGFQLCNERSIHKTLCELESDQSLLKESIKILNDSNSPGEYEHCFLFVYRPSSEAKVTCQMETFNHWLMLYEIVHNPLQKGEDVVYHEDIFIFHLKKKKSSKLIFPQQIFVPVLWYSGLKALEETGQMLSAPHPEPRIEEEEDYRKDDDNVSQHTRNTSNSIMSLPQPFALLRQKENLFDGMQGKDVILFDIEALMPIATAFVDLTHGGQPLHVIWNLERFLKSALDLEMKIVFVHFSRCHQKWEDQDLDACEITLVRRKDTLLDKLLKSVVVAHVKHVAAKHSSSTSSLSISEFENWSSPDYRSFVKTQSPSFIVTHQQSLPFSLDMMMRHRINVVQNVHFKNQILWGEELMLSKSQQREDSYPLEMLYDEERMTSSDTPPTICVVQDMEGTALRTHLELTKRVCLAVIQNADTESRLDFAWASLSSLLSVFLSHNLPLEKRSFAQLPPSIQNNQSLGNFFDCFHKEMLVVLSEQPHLSSKSISNLVDGRMICAIVASCVESENARASVKTTLRTQADMDVGEFETYMQNGVLFGISVTSKKNNVSTKTSTTPFLPLLGPSYLKGIFENVKICEVDEDSTTPHAVPGANPLEQPEILRQHYHSTKPLSHDHCYEPLADDEHAHLSKCALQKLANLRSKDEIVYLDESDADKRGVVSMETISLSDTTDPLSVCEKKLRQMIEMWIVALRGNHYEYSLLDCLLRQLLLCVGAASREVQNHSERHESHNEDQTMAEFFHRIHDFHTVLEQLRAFKESQSAQESTIPYESSEQSASREQLASRASRHILNKCVTANTRQCLCELVIELERDFHKHIAPVPCTRSFLSLESQSLDTAYIEKIQFMETRSVQYVTKIFPLHSNDGEVLLEYYPDPWQQKFIQHVDRNVEIWQGNRENQTESCLVVGTPTSSGKTFIVHYVIERLLKFSEEATMIFVAPTITLCTQMYASVTNKFRLLGNTQSICGLFTRFDRINISNCRVLIVTPECLRILLLSPEMKQRERYIEQSKVVCFDEIHQIADSEHTEAWAAALALVRCPFIALSASIANPHEFGGWIKKFLEHKEKRYNLFTIPEKGDTPLARDPPIEYCSYENGRFIHRHPVTLLNTNQMRHQQLKSLSFGEVDVLLEVMKKVDPSEGQDWQVRKKALFASPHHILNRIEYEKFRQSLEERIIGFESDKLSELQNCLSNAQCKNDTTQEAQNVRGVSLDVHDDADPTLLTARCILDARDAGYLPALCFILSRHQIHKSFRALLEEMFSTGRRLLDEPLKEKFIGLSIPDTNSCVEFVVENCTVCERNAIRSFLLNGHIPIDEEHHLKIILKGDEEEEGEQEGDKEDDEFSDADENSINDQRFSSFSVEQSSDHSSHTTTTIFKFPLIIPCPNSTQNPISIFDHARFHNLLDELGLLTRRTLRVSCKNHEQEALLALRYGIGFHYNKLLPLHRQTVERLAYSKRLALTFATGTLSYGINFPTKSVIIAAESRFLHNVQFRQCAGRSGRRGFDRIGRCILLNMSHSKMARYISSPLPKLRASFTVSTSFLLRMLVYQDQLSTDSRTVQDCKSVMTQPFNHKDHCNSNQHLYYNRLGIEILQRLGLLSNEALPLKHAGLCHRLFYCEPNVFLFVEFFKKHFSQFVYENTQIRDKNLLIVLLHFFHANVIQNTERNSHRVLPPIEKVISSWGDTVDSYDAMLLAAYKTYLQSYCTDLSHRDHLRKASMLPLTLEEQNCDTNSSAQSVHETLALSRWQSSSDNRRIISQFCALSGHDDDSLKDVETLVSMVNHLILMDLSIVPLSRKHQHHRNFLLKFYEHQSIDYLVQSQEVLNHKEATDAVRDFRSILRAISAYYSNFQEYDSNTGRGSQVTIGDKSYMLCSQPDENGLCCAQELGVNGEVSTQDLGVNEFIQIKHTHEYLLSKACHRIDARFSWEIKSEFKQSRKINKIQKMANSIVRSVPRFQTPHALGKDKDYYLQRTDTIVQNYRKSAANSPSHHQRLIAVQQIVRCKICELPFSFEEESVFRIWNNFKDVLEQRAAWEQIVFKMIPGEGDLWKEARVEFTAMLHADERLDEQQELNLLRYFDILKDLQSENTPQNIINCRGFNPDVAKELLRKHLYASLHSKYTTLRDRCEDHYDVQWVDIPESGAEINSFEEMVSTVAHIEKVLEILQISLPQEEEDFHDPEQEISMNHLIQEIFRVQKICTTTKFCNKRKVWRAEL